VVVLLDAVTANFATAAKKRSLAFCRDRLFRISSHWYSRLASQRQGRQYWGKSEGAREKVLLERHRLFKRIQKSAF
jgi:hypothetical protein